MPSITDVTPRSDVDNGIVEKSEEFQEPESFLEALLQTDDPHREEYFGDEWSRDDSLSNLFNTQSSSSGRYYNEEEDENGNIRTGDDLASLFLYCRTCGRGKRSVKNQNAT
ncbi:unnamed protein product [Anisakis simplex]|uniref:Ovule protein n=1 Tax=Anisakis simplex TaxID=6269 RepID=A0A0M3JZT0_ANISI|nr:unnamed protein product [Anisakis simplex]